MRVCNMLRPSANLTAILLPVGVIPSAAVFQVERGMTQCAKAQAVSLSNALSVSSFTSHFFRIVRIVFVPNPARTS